MPDSVARVAALGPLRAWLGDNEVDLGSRRQRAVFATLLVGQQRLVHRDELVAAVWGETAPASAIGNVHTYVSGLRQVLEPGRSRRSGGALLVSEPNGYRLRIEAAGVDLHEFARLRAEAGERTAAGDHRGAVAALDSALALWCGEALCGVPGPSARHHRDELARQRLQAIEDRARARLLLDDHAELIPDLTALVYQHPLREPLWELLVLALYREHRHTEALSRLAELRDIVRAQLGTTPGPAIRLLHQQVLTCDPALDPNPAGRRADARLSVVTRSGRPQRRSEPLPGRRRETTVLRRLLDDLVAYRGGCAQVEGEPGMGKSALLTAGLADAHDRGVLVNWVRVDRRRPVAPLGVIRQCLGSPQALAKLPTSADASATDELAGELAALCAHGPALIVVDDLHEADDESKRLWGRVLRETRRLPLLVVTAHRPVVGDLLARQHSTVTDDVVVLRLEPLATAAVSDQVVQLIGAPPGPNLRRLLTSAGGNPERVGLVLKALRRDRLLSIDSERVEIAARLTAPAAVGAVAAYRLCGLTEAVWDLVRCAARLGDTFTVADVAAATTMPLVDVLEAISAACQARVLAPAGNDLTFHHPLLRQAVQRTFARPHTPPGRNRAAG